jgi:hypothetical protein
LFGNETFLAVQRFQKQAFPNRPAEWDGRVGKNTLAEMDRRLPKAVVPPGPQAPSMSALAERDKFTSLLWAQAALASLSTARAFLQSGGAIAPAPDQPPPLRIALRALETHFHFSTVIASRLSAIDFITLVYQKTVNVLAQSQTFFVDDTTSQEALNGTPAHVPFGKGKVNFTPAFRTRDNATGDGFGPKCRAAMVLHEPVHVVDHPQASFAANHVHENSPSYASQPAAMQLHNAHSYACFGQHCFFGADTRFGIGKPEQ